MTTVLASFLLSIPLSAFAYSNPLTLSDSWKWDTGVFYGEGDPYILKHNGIYYLYVSTVDDKSGVKAWKSEDLVNWEYGGLVTKEPTTKAAYAPEVVYWNGDFYMYTSPGGHGHYVYKSSNPLGPFVKQTNNLGMGIDGHVFIDDDGKWYFYSTGDKRIDARPMSDPYTFGQVSNTGAEMNGWTEGPTVLKRNSKYYMTYTGNHVWNKAYRVDYASSDSPITGFSHNLDQNPILINSEGSNVGLGHNSVVRGPDLDSEYMVYHSHANPGRYMNLDRIAWNGEKMLVLGPTTSEQPNPDLPDFSERFTQSSFTENWENTKGGSWSIASDMPGWLQQTTIENTHSFKQLTKASTASDYTAEFNMKALEQGTVGDPQLGAVFSYKDENNYGLAVLNPKKNQLESYFIINGVKQSSEATDLPKGYDYSKLHQLRVEKSSATYKIFVDGMQKQTRKMAGLNGGKIGYITSNLHAAFGYTAFSNKVNGSNVFKAYKPLPGKIEAVHYNTGGEGVGFHDSTAKNTSDLYRRDSAEIKVNSEGGYNVSLNKPGEWFNYNVNVAEDATYNVDLRVSASSDDAKLKLVLDDSTDLTGVLNIPKTDEWKTFSIEGIDLPKGKHSIKIVVNDGTFDLANMNFQKYKEVKQVISDFNDGKSDGWEEIEGYWTVKTNKPSPFDAHKPIPGSISAAYYITGGEGVAYHETTAENIGGVLRGDAVDIRNNPKGGTAVGWNQTGEWFKYNVSIKETGLYNVQLNTATTFQSAKVRLWLDDKTDLTGVLDVPNTGDWNNWQPVIKEGITLPEGDHTIKVEIVEGEFDFTSLDFTSFDIHKPVPGIIEAAEYNLGGEGVGYHDNTAGNSGGKYRADSVDIRVNPEGGFAVTSNQTGEWLAYDIDIEEEGTYGLDLLTSATKDGGKAKLLIDDKIDVTGEIDIPNTGDQNNWKSVSLKDISLPAGKHTLKLVTLHGEFDVSRLTLHRFDNHRKLPGKIMAAEYITGGEGIGYHDNSPVNIGGKYRRDSVDIRVNPEGGYNVGWNQAGEWLKYNVDIEKEDKYQVAIRIATDLEGNQIRLWLDDTVDLTGIIDVPKTGGWDNWESVIKENVFLPAGKHTIKAEMVKGEFDFRSIDFTLDKGEEPPAAEGEYSAAPGTFAKSVIGDHMWKDYTVEADINIGAGTGDGGIIFRVNNPANGIELGQNNPDFMQGYLAYINKDGVHLGKFNYNWLYLKGAKISAPLNTWQHMKVVAKGTNIKIFVGDMDTPKIDYTDNSSTAFTQGKVGLRSNYNFTRFDNFHVKPIETSHKTILKLLDKYNASGEINHSLYKQLSNKLEQSKQHMEKGHIEQSLKHLNDFQEFLDKAKGDYVSKRAKEELLSDGDRLLRELKRI
ncbi:glycoside hydrolase family protein [Neobacillus bataviensis LMG 21833]|uniref:Glycoside hydrolase family protein n=1 Tax=Neobacillus bataviensis LMG 21833 TaxID=1117379 RepID=K6DTJ1_9BACI|nr:carbohydrate-binding protein [Neobacillus bataviensis]EKN71558.1 glycoside hydrolase family protein [Neobacillus bataviensis LMG 21833]